MVFTSFYSFAQRTTIYVNEDEAYKNGVDLYNKEKYVAAQKEFRTIISKQAAHSEIRVNAEYYNALCAIELFNGDAEFLISSFVTNHSESPKVVFAQYAYGNFLYRKKRYKDALEQLEKVKPSQLSNDQRTEYYFKKAYCHFQENEFEKALPYFEQVKDVENKFTASATYYHAHILYTQKKYETALKGFLKLTENENFAPVVPYYIAQIYFLQAKYQQVTEYAPALLDSSNTKRTPEIAHLIASSYYKLKKYGEAIPFYEKFIEKGSQIQRDDYYELAYCCYKTKQNDKAIENFKKVSSTTDSLGQLAYYNLANCYLNKNEKKFARSSFGSAADLDFDLEIKEDALFSFAKLSYELSLNPYNEAIRALEDYIKKYPESSRVDEAYQFLTNIYLATKNYQQAINSIEKIKSKNLEQQYAYQKACYFRGVELFNDTQYAEAILLFTKSFTYPKDKNINALAEFWKAESNYRLNNFEGAIENYTKFIFEPNAVLTEQLNNAHYGIGYSYFKKEDYTNAAIWFRKFTAYKDEKNTKKLNDAFARTGDCYFITKDLLNAIVYYDEALKIKSTSNDYPLFQKASSLGIQAKYDQKTELLNQLIKEYPKSSYIDDAKYELGNTYLAQNKNEEAIVAFKNVIKDYPNSSYVKKSLLKLSLVYYNQDKNDLALQTQQQILTSYPNTTEATEALSGMRNIYVEQGNVDDFENFLKANPALSLSTNALDSTKYEAAENRYMKGDFEGAGNDFKNYISKFPNGQFLLNANYYFADCANRLGNFNDALIGYDFVIAKPKNTFTERSLLNAARIKFKQEKYQEAILNYSELEKTAEIAGNLNESKIGLMRSYNKLEQCENASERATKLLNTDKIANEIIYESHLIIAKCLLKQQNDSAAFKQLSTLIKLTKNELGAEAKYLLAEIYYRQKNYKQTEVTCFELVNQIPAYDYWIAKSFILLSDVYVATNDNFQAKQTLQSIIDNYEGEELLAIAKQKLKSIEDAEKALEEKKKQEEIEINLNNSNINEKLFEDSESETIKTETTIEGGSINE